MILQISWSSKADQLIIRSSKAGQLMTFGSHSPSPFLRAASLSQQGFEAESWQKLPIIIVGADSAQAYRNPMVGLLQKSNF